MEVTLAVIAGPHAGKQFNFNRRETFLVGRSRTAHFRLSKDDPYFSRRHFMIEVHPPRCRVLDLGSRNGTRVNGKRVRICELKHDDEVQAGHTTFRVVVPTKDPKDFLIKSISTAQYLSQGWCPAGYELQGVAGEGAMGVVYQACRLSDRLPVAIKRIKTVDGITQKQCERFLREAEMLSKLTHPNVVRMLDRGIAKGELYLVIEWVQGTDLKRYMSSRSRIGITSAVRIACQMLAGLAHAHSRGIVHRDIKPSNLLVFNLNNRRRVKLADFGLARTWEACELSGLTMQGEVGGTPAYMAPEQVTHYRQVRPAADQFSAAATIYTLLTRKKIQEFSHDVGEMLVQITSRDPVPITKYRSDLPPGLADSIMRALSRNPNDRFPDVSSFRAALRPFAAPTH